MKKVDNSVALRVEMMVDWKAKLWVVLMVASRVDC